MGLIYILRIELLQRGNEARRGQTQGLVIRASRAVYFCLLIHAGPTQGGASKRPTTAAASRPRRGRRDTGSVACDPCSLAEAIHCRSAQTFGSAEGPSRAVRNRTRLPRLTAEQASAPPTLGRPNMAPRWPWGCAADWQSKHSLSCWHHHGWHQRREIARKTAYPVGHACSPRA